MKTTLIGLFSLCLACALIELFTPAGQERGIERHLRLLTGLCLLCALTQPLIDAAESAHDLPDRIRDWMEKQSAVLSPETSDYDARWQREQEELGARAAAVEIGTMLREKFDLTEDTCRVRVSVNDTGDTLTEVTVVLSGRAIWKDTHVMEDFVRKTFGCPCVIYIER